MELKISVSNKEYDEKYCVFFRNTAQSIFYIENGCCLKDLFIDSRHKLVFVFSREEHEKCIPLWMDNKKNKENEIE